jgi:hypothetical protein
MTSSAAAIDRLNWADIAAQLDTEGYALLPGLLGADLAQGLAYQAPTPQKPLNPYRWLPAIWGAANYSISVQACRSRG